MRLDPALSGFPAALSVTRSFSGRKWIIRETDQDEARNLALSADISPTLAQLLLTRGVTAEGVADYLKPTLKRLLPEPMTLKDMDQSGCAGGAGCQPRRDDCDLRRL